MKKGINIFCAFQTLLTSFCMCENQGEIKQYNCSERDPVIYNSKSPSFEKFLSWSNEKQKIAEEVGKVVGAHNKLLLDIGAGNGLLTNLLSSNFDHVTAIEPGPVLFEALKKNCCSDKFTLINLPFEKTTLQIKFDVIVASYSLKYIPDSSKELLRIKDLLAKNGLFLLVEQDPKSDFLKFYHRYKKDILGTSLVNATTFDYKNLLSKFFKVKEIYFTATLNIPSVGDTLDVFDFFYDVELSSIKKETLDKVRQDLYKQFGNGVVNINLQQVLYICSK